MQSRDLPAPTLYPTGPIRLRLFFFLLIEAELLRREADDPVVPP